MKFAAATTYYFRSVITGVHSLVGWFGINCEEYVLH